MVEATNGKEAGDSSSLGVAAMQEFEDLDFLLQIANSDFDGAQEIIRMLS